MARPWSGCGRAKSLRTIYRVGGGCDAGGPGVSGSPPAYWLRRVLAIRDTAHIFFYVKRACVGVKAANDRRIPYNAPLRSIQQAVSTQLDNSSLTLYGLVVYAGLYCL